MKIYIITDYKNKYPTLKGRKLTDALINKCHEKMGEEKSPTNMEISRTEKGKPYCEWLQRKDGIHFSVSHSKDVFACIFARENIGLDIQHRRKVKSEKLAKRYFSAEEAELAMNNNEFFRLWTRKEAFCKYTGEGLSQAMNKLDVLHREDVYFIDFMIEDGQDDEDCFCSICIKACEPTEDKGETIDEIQILD